VFGFVKPVTGVLAVMKRRNLLNKYAIDRWFVKRQQRWTTFLTRFWSYTCCIGRVAWQRKVGGILRVGMFARVKKRKKIKRHVVRLVVLLDALNVVVFRRVKRRSSRVRNQKCRERLRKHSVWRQRKLARMFPVRRQGRSKHKVK